MDLSRYVVSMHVFFSERVNEVCIIISLATFTIYSNLLLVLCFLVMMMMIVIVSPYCMRRIITNEVGKAKCAMVKSTFCFL